jgi:adenosylhomocysteine nucleosidase
MDMPRTSAARIAIIVAMEREVAPLIRHWNARTIEHGGHQYQLFENAEAALICGGIGAEAARRATEAIINLQAVKPTRVISAGFAGALDDSLKVGDVLEPRIVINAADGVRTEVTRGEGILVSYASVAGTEQKARLAKAYGAIAVDMEAAAVAQGAQAQGVEFGALKAVSDVAGFEMPDLDGFVSHDGSFRTARFAGHVALRPRLWGTAIALARNSSAASRALCAALESYLSRAVLSREATKSESLLPHLNQTNLAVLEDETYAGAHTQGRTEEHTRTIAK